MRVTARDRLDKLVKEQVELVVDLQGLTTIQQICQRGTRNKTTMLERCLPWLLSISSSPAMMRSLYLNQDMFKHLPRYSMCMAILQSGSLY